VVRHRRARLHGSIRVQGLSLLVDVLNYPVFADDEGRAIRKSMLLVQNSVLFADLPLKVAEQRESHSNLLGKCTVCGYAIDADSEHLRAGLLEFGDISLIRLQLLRSAGSEGQNVKGEHNVLLAQKLF
jgi:hypothetical protein